MGTSRGYGSGSSKYGSSGYGGSGSSYLNSSYGNPRTSSYRTSSYEPRAQYGESVMDRIKQLNTDTRSGSGSYTPLSSRRATTTRDYGGGGGGSTPRDRYSSRSGSDYSAGNRSGYMSDYGGSNPSLYNSWDRTSSRSSRYGGQSRETSPVSTRAPLRSTYDYSSSASPSPYSTYKSSAVDRRSPPRRYDRQHSNSRSDVYEELPRTRKKWESSVYGSSAGPTPRRSSTRESLPPQPVKPPPNKYSDSDDSAPEDDKGHSLRYMTSRGTSPMPEPGKREARRSKDLSSSSISKVKRVKCSPKDTRSRNSRGELRRRNLVDCGTQVNLDEAPKSRRNRPGGGDSRSREDMAKLAAMSLFKDDDQDGEYYNYKDRYQAQMSPPPSGDKHPKSPRGSGRQQDSGSKVSQEVPQMRTKNAPSEEQKGWRKAVYDDPPAPKKKETSHYLDDSDVPSEKGWRKSVYGEPTPQMARLRRHQTEEDLSKAAEIARAKRGPMTSTPLKQHEEESSLEEETPLPTSPRNRHSREMEGDKRRSQNSELEKRRSQNNSEGEKRRSQNNSEPTNYRRSSSRDSILDDKQRRRRTRTSSRELLDESEPSTNSSRTALTPDSLSLRESIEKVQVWKQNLPSPVPQDDHHLHVVKRHPETGFPRSDSGEYFSANEHHPSQKDHEEALYQDPVFLSEEHSGNATHDLSDRESEVLSPGGNRRRRNRRHLSRELSTESAHEDMSHHPVNKERLRKSELNRSIENERKEQEELERRRRIYAGEDPAEVERSIKMRQRKSGSADGHARDESPNRRRNNQRYSSRQGSREGMIDDKPPRKDKREMEPHTSDSSTFGFNREGSPNRPSSRYDRRSRHSSREGMLDDDDQQAQYMRPHSMVVSNESLAKLSAASSIPSMHSAMTDDGTIQNSMSMQSIASNEVQEHPIDGPFTHSKSHQSIDSNGSLPDIVPEDCAIRDVPKADKRNTGFIGGTEDIDNLLNFSPDEEEFVEKGKIQEGKVKTQHSHILDAPVPRQPSPLKPQNKDHEEKLIDIEEPPKISSLAKPTSPQPKRASREDMTPTGKEMWALLDHNKGLVVIADILDLCQKPKKARFIRVPGAEDEEMKSFRGYNTANELLDALQVDTKKLEDCALQIYRYHNGTQGDYGTYLDLESTIDEQTEELEGFQDQRKNALILRTQLTVRVHAVIEKLLNSSGRELRRALFSLKQIFQDDKDLVHEFVNNDGLDCLIKVGAEADQNYQNYILRALGQVMLYVDGMNGVINHNATIQWLYSLLASKFRLVVKTALKLLLVFVEYTETNALHLTKAVHAVDKKKMVKPWTNIMTILDEKDGGDSELLVYAMTLINKVINGLPDQDSFYDVTDALEELGMERITQRHMNRKGADLDLLSQFNVYEAALKAEDGEEENISQLESLRRTPRIKAEGDVRKSRRYSTGPPGRHSLDSCPADEYSQKKKLLKERAALLPEEHEQFDQMPDHQRRRALFEQSQNEFNEQGQRYINGTGRSPSEETLVDNQSDHSSVGDSVRSRRERRNRQRDLIKAQAEVNSQLRREGDRMSVASSSSSSSSDVVATTTGTTSTPAVPTEAQPDSKYSSLSSLSDTDSLDNLHKKGRDPPDKRLPHEESGYQSHDDHRSINQSHNQSHNELHDEEYGSGEVPLSNNKRWLLYKQAHKDDIGGMSHSDIAQFQQDHIPPPIDDHHRDDLNTNQNSGPLHMGQPEAEPSRVKAELERLASQKTDKVGPKKAAGPLGDKTGLISQAMENLTRKNEPVKQELLPQKPDVKLTESDLQWERLHKRFHRSLKINDMDFTDLKDEDDDDIFAPPKIDFGPGGAPPPPPMSGCPPPPPPPGMPPPPPPPMGGPPPPPPPFGALPLPGGPNSSFLKVDLPPPPGVLPKTKKTVKLHWKIVTPDLVHPATKGETVWKHIVPIQFEPEKLEHLFETRAAELKQKRQEAAGKKELNVLDPKRSNAINIGLTVLPPPRTIKTAIMKMDNSIMNKEGIEKILMTMIPSEEEKNKILEAQLANPDIPLGTAEQFLLTLSSITELQARLNVWLFKLDYENIESEVAEPLMDLKKGVEELFVNKTFKYILSAILTIGNFLNGAQVRGFSIDYLAKVPEVKDTVHKHSILHHLCTIILEQFPESSDLYSDIGPITRCSRVDWDELERKLNRLEVDCKASWDNLRAIVKHDGSSNTQLKSKMSEFLADAAERIMILQIVYKRVMNRFRKLLLYMGLPARQAQEEKVNHFCKTVCEFALEYRTTREKVVQQLEKKANQRERKKTRGKMIVDMGKFKGSKAPKDSRSADDQSEEALSKVLSNGYMSSDDRGTLGRRRRLGPADARKSSVSSRGGVTTDSEMYDTGDDEILEACVRTATTPSTRTAPKERKRARNSRKSLRRTLKNGLSQEELSTVNAHTENV